MGPSISFLLCLKSGMSVSISSYSLYPACHIHKTGSCTETNSKETKTSCHCTWVLVDPKWTLGTTVMEEIPTIPSSGRHGGQ